MPQPVSPSRRTRPTRSAAPTEGDLPQRFRQVYYHLYSNSNVSRAETLLSDLSLLLLAKLQAEAPRSGVDLGRFLAGHTSANRQLLPALRARFPRLVRASERFYLDDTALRHALGELEGVRLTESAAHVLGEAFQALIGPRIRGDKGQFFTPRSLVAAMISILSPREGERILDPACGTGGFLYEALAHLEARGGRPARLDGADKDRDLARFAAALLACRGATGQIRAVNSLSEREWRAADLADSYDVIVTNPPFGTKIPIRERTILQEFQLAREWRHDARQEVFRPTRAVLDGQDPQVLFLELCIRRLTPGGRLGIVLPEGMFGNRRQAHVWDFVRSQGEIVALLDCPRTTFQPGTDTKTNVLFFRKGRSRRNRTQVAVAVALTCGHDRRGRSLRADGTPYPDDFPAIGRTLTFHRSVTRRGSRWSRVKLTHPSYLVPRYYAQTPAASPAEQSLLDGARWESLGELVEHEWIDVRKGHEVGSEAYGTGTVPFVRTSDIANFEISADPTKSVSDDIYEDWAPQQRLRPGSILMVTDGRYRIGATAILTARSHRCVVQSHLRIIDALRPAEIDPFALLFALNLPSVRRRMRDLVFIQSTLGTLGPRLFELQIPLLADTGPWSPTVRRFRDHIAQRDALLTELATMIGPEFEL